ncbi:O-succinylbenzoate synthase [Kineosphaera limosa]|uniref:o-succinylbenzoate synthase n=1 Tax=Kineosphaera limosa NBRC 100340 TaxID=1184609 RepID=K6WRK0_9MICO|nr:o-succinylbenzoate synthase [Kineosphaera limosa]NYE01756.1 O-succinylbenzoate synthase [Kineosphaera limosa]GAB96446.1 o-succinylbenzoate synthase [Kineosphaera limosa NBRC 100340]
MTPVSPAPDRPLPPVAELLAGASVVAVPLRMRFRGVQQREAMLLRGPAGWGEFAPFPEYDDAEAARWLAAAIEAAWVGWPEPVRDRVAVNATVPAVAPELVGEVLARYDGCATVKIKVAQAGQELRDDLDRVAAVREHAPLARLRVDANGAWDVEQARLALSALAPYELEYAEQPCRSVPELARLRVDLARAGVDVPIAADESVRRADDPLEVARQQAADVIVVKVAPLGGVRAALAIVAQVGLPAVVSSALDTSVGIRAGVALAAALPELDYACGLGTVELLERDVARPRLVPRAGLLAPGDLHVDEPRLPDLAPAPERIAWWVERLRRCHALLARPSGG